MPPFALSVPPAAPLQAVRTARLAGAGLCALVLVLLAALLWLDYRHELQVGTRAVDNFARAVERQFWLGLDGIEEDLRGHATAVAAHRAELLAGDQRARSLVRATLEPLRAHRGIAAVAVSDGGGRVLVADRFADEGGWWPRPPRLAGSGRDPLALGAPEFVDGAWRLAMALPIPGSEAEGRPLWIQAQLDVQALTGYLLHFELGDGVALIRHRDGAVVARHPGYPGTQAAALDSVPPVAATAAPWAVRWTMPGDPVERLYGHRATPDYPFSVLVGRSMDEVLAGWRESATLSALVLLLLSLAWLAVYALLARARDRQLRAGARLEAQSAVLLEAQRMAALGHWQLEVASGRVEASEQA